MKSATRTIIGLILVALLPALLCFIIGIVTYFRGPEPGSRIPDPELEYFLPLLFSCVWTILILTIAGIAVLISRLHRRSRFRRRMRGLGVMDERGHWNCSSEEAERFQSFYG
jgi:hypothetical protein